MTENKKEYGRTFFDFISEHPKITFFAFLLLIGSIIFLIFRGNSLKVGEVEIGNKEKIIRDTVFRIERETIIVEKPRIVTEYAEPPKTTKVKTDKTEIEVNDQSANINTGTNSGIIGNNNTVNVNEKPLTFSETDKKELIRLINSELDKLPKGKSRCVVVSGINGDKRSVSLAQIVFEYLNNVGEGIAQVIYNKPIEGVSVALENECVEVRIFIV